MRSTCKIHNVSNQISKPFIKVIKAWAPYEHNKIHNKQHIHIHVYGIGSQPHTYMYMALAPSLTHTCIWHWLPASHIHVYGIGSQPHTYMYMALAPSLTHTCIWHWLPASHIHVYGIGSQPHTYMYMALAPSLTHTCIWHWLPASQCLYLIWVTANSVRTYTYSRTLDDDSLFLYKLYLFNEDYTRRKKH